MAKTRFFPLFWAVFGPSRPGPGPCHDIVNQNAKCLEQHCYERFRPNCFSGLLQLTPRDFRTFGPIKWPFLTGIFGLFDNLLWTCWQSFLNFLSMDFWTFGQGFLDLLFFSWVVSRLTIRILECSNVQVLFGGNCFQFSCVQIAFCSFSFFSSPEFLFHGRVSVVWSGSPKSVSYVNAMGLHISDVLSLIMPLEAGQKRP